MQKKWDLASLEKTSLREFRLDNKIVRRDSILELR